MIMKNAMLVSPQNESNFHINLKWLCANAHQWLERNNDMFGKTPFWAEWDKVILLVYSNSRRFVLLCKRHFVRSNAMLTFSLKRKPGTRDYSWTNWTTRFGIVTMQNNGVFFAGNSNLLSTIQMRWKCT